MKGNRTGGFSAAAAEKNGGGDEQEGSFMSRPHPADPTDRRDSDLPMWTSTKLTSKSEPASDSPPPSPPRPSPPATARPAPAARPGARSTHAERARRRA